MEQFDELLRSMASKEECIVPKGFDEKIQNTLDNLPSRAKKAGLGAVKGMLIAAAACAVLVGTAFAASPTLRGMLAQALGGFAPYAQEQEGEPYVIDGIEFRIKSVLADDFTVRAYVEARDLEGGRFGEMMSAFGFVDIPKKDTGEGFTASTFRASVLDYDAETETALLAVSSWGQVAADDLTGAEVRIFSLENRETGVELLDGGENFCAPVEVKPIPSLSMSPDAKLASDLRAEEVRLSAVGLSAIFRYDAGWGGFAGKNVQAKLADGSLVDAPWEGGQGDFGAESAEGSRKVLVWNFTEPVDVDNIQGIYVGEDYFPVR